MEGFADAGPCYEGYPHTAGHNGIGGVVSILDGSDRGCTGVNAD